jgi:NADH:ubiquinone oxidoreductase subunit 2 (subunit N)
MFQGLIEEKRFIVVGFFLLGTILSILYFWKIIQQIFFIKPQNLTNQNNNITQFSTVSEVAIIFSATLCIFFGIFTNFTLAKSQTLATIFLQNLS